MDFWFQLFWIHFQLFQFQLLCAPFGYVIVLDKRLHTIHSNFMIWHWVQSSSSYVPYLCHEPWLLDIGQDIMLDNLFCFFMVLLTKFLWWYSKEIEVKLQYQIHLNFLPWEQGEIVEECITQLRIWYQSPTGCQLIFLHQCKFWKTIERRE